jgi:hypothetical protein
VSISRENPFFVIEESFIVSQDRKKLVRYLGSESRVLIKKEIEVIDKSCFGLCSFVCEVVFEAESRLRLIDEDAFSTTDLRSIIIPSGVEVIGECCFPGCESLSEVIFEAGSRLQLIGSGAFTWTVLKTIRIPKSVKEIGRNCFFRCKSLHEVIFEGDAGRLPEIARDAFEGSSVAIIRIPRGTGLGFVVPGCKIEYVDRDEED